MVTTRARDACLPFVVLLFLAGGPVVGYFAHDIVGDALHEALEPRRFGDAMGLAIRIPSVVAGLLFGLVLALITRLSVRLEQLEEHLAERLGGATTWDVEKSTPVGGPQDLGLSDANEATPV